MSNTQTLDEVKEFEKFSEYAKKAIIIAFEQALSEGLDKVFPRHLFIGILSNRRSVGSRLLARFGIDIDRTIKSFLGGSKFMNKISRNFRLEFDDDVKKVLVNSVILASEMGHVYVGTEHQLLNLLRLENEDFVKDLQAVNINYDTCLNALMNFATYHHGVFNKDGEHSDSLTSSDQSALGVFAKNMNDLAKNGKFLPIYGRDEEIERILHILSRKTKSNPILVGEAGVGKTAIVEGLAQKIVAKIVPDSFRNKKIVSLDLAGILAGSKIRGDVEERILAIIKEAQENPDIILFIDEIHMIIGAGSAGQGTMDIANILKPYLTNGNISLIGATTLNEYQRYFEDDSALIRRFQSVMIDEITEDEAVNVLRNISPKLEEFHNVKVSEDALHDCVILSSRYINERYLPDKAIDVLDEACAKIKILNSKNSHNSSSKIESELERIRIKKTELIKKGNFQEAATIRKQEIKLNSKLGKTKDHKTKQTGFIVDSQQVRKVVAEYTKIPVDKMDSDAIMSVINLEKQISKDVIGQVNAISKVASSIKRSRVGIQDVSKPIGSFLFLGPTGVGKTQLAKSLAKVLFGDESKLIQIDMSEYMEQHSVSKLIGSPPGYVGFQDGGQLTEKIRRNPYSVLLFDEIEKAHPDLLNILLQILDEGHLKDNKGREVNFKNTIVIMTSNIGADTITDDKVLGFHLDQKDDVEEISKKDFENITSKLMEQVKEEFSPELLNRIDDIIVFRGLDDNDMVEITKLEIGKLNNRIREKSITLAVSQSVVEYIASEGASREYGARNIKRKIQELIENPLADLVLQRNLIDKKQLTVISLKKSKKNIKFEVKN